MRTNDDKGRNEFDLMAYVDGLIDDVPAHRERLAAYLAENPEESVRVDAYRAQNAALRRRYGRFTEEPVPKRLYDVLERPAPRPRFLTRNTAAVAALTVVAAVAGWWVGRSDSPPNWPPAYFLEGDDFVQLDRPTIAGPSRVAGVGTAAPMNWLSERISLSVRVPDLSNRGYTVMRKDTVRIADDRLVRIDYSTAGGRRFSLYLRPWWENSSPGVRLVRQNGRWLAFWRDGPLASVLTSSLPRDEVEKLAREIRRELHEKNRSAPRMKANPPAVQLPSFADGGPKNTGKPRDLPAGPAAVRPMRPVAPQSVGPSGNR